MAPVTAKTPKEVKAKKTTSAAAKKPRAHPPYSEMINESITALKERTGSSQFAIAKFIEEKQKANLPNNFKKLLLVQLKKLVATGKLVKVKNSFKLPPKSSSTSTTTAATAKKPKSSPTAAAAAAKKPKSKSTAAVKAKKPKPNSTDAAAKKPKPKAKKASVNSIRSPAKKVVVAAKSKKPKSIKSPVKKVAAKKGKK